MQALKFTQLASSEVKQEAISDFNITSRGNCIALLGGSNETVALELINEAHSQSIFPYRYTEVEIPTDRPCNKFTGNIKLPIIYEKSNVLECQELALEPVYVAKCYTELPKPKAVQLDWAPCKRQNSQALLGVLSNYGACRVLCKKHSLRRWHQVLYDLNEHYGNIVFPMSEKPLKIETLKQFKALIDVYWITAFAWHPAPHTHIIYTANAAGHVVASKLDANSEQLKEYCKHKTKLGRINYLQACEDFLLISSISGVVQLLRLKHDDREEKPAFVEIDCLWSKADRLGCRKAEITFAPELNAYFVVFTKGAHVLAYRLTATGEIVCSATLYVSGIKITGLERWHSANEFIITTITGQVRRIQLTCPNAKELQIDEQQCEIDIDAANMQIMGVVATPNKQLWSFVLYHNKEYTYANRAHAVNAYISVCKPTTTAPLTTLTNIRINTMKSYLDYIVAIRLDMQSHYETQIYTNFLELTQAKFPNEFNDAFVQKLQIKLFIVQSAIKYQNLKFKQLKKITNSEHEFLLLALPITHIVCRLQYLQRLCANGNSLTGFQKYAGTCLRAKFALLIAELKALTQTDEHPLKQTISRFIETATNAQHAASTANVVESSANEQCNVCDEPVNATTLLCASAHTLRRCCVSFVQLPLFNRRYCQQCNAQALEDDAFLQQLFPANEYVKCTFCRFQFLFDEI